MAYQSLYRRYRPRRFSEVKGQDHVVGTLRNAVRKDRVGHAYLFSGPRGTGKTTSARILAKALNCEDLRDGEPCCACASCRAIEAGTSYDLQELDAASNNKVEQMRDLIERVALGSPGRTKVYILDEVHMLSAGASNALLKTLEEPPPHVVFVLATTDPQKVLPTIRSRTQHFEFHLLGAGALADHVRWVIDDAGLEVAPGTVEHVVRQGRGSARDALSALDQAAAGGVTDGSDQADALVDALCATDPGAALAAVSQATGAGRDPRVLGEALVGRLRDVFLHRMGASIGHVPEADRDRVASWGAQLTDRATTRAPAALGAALLEMRQAPDPRIPLEVALVRLTRLDTGADLDALLSRIERLERQVADAAEAVPAEALTPPPPPPSADPGRPHASPGDAPVPPSVPVPRADPPGPAAAARAALAGGEEQAAPSPPPFPSSDPPPAPAPSPTPTAAGPAEAVGPAEAAEATDPVEAAGMPDRDSLTLAWADAVLPRLGGMTKALYNAGRFTSVEDGVAVFAVPNEVHLQRCRKKQPEVDAVLVSHFGRPVPMRLVVDDGRTAVESGGDHAAPGEVDPETIDPELIAPETIDPETVDPETIDIDDLVDADDEPRSHVDRLTRAFPGAELIEEPHP